MLMMICRYFFNVLVILMFDKQHMMGYDHSIQVPLISCSLVVVKLSEMIKTKHTGLQLTIILVDLLFSL